MSETLTFQTIIQFRIKIDDMGKVSAPEILRKFTSPISDTKKFNKKNESKSLVTTFGEEETV